MSTKTATKVWSWKLLLMTLAAAMIAAPATVTAEEKEEIKEIAGHMEVISRNFKKLRRSIQDPAENAASVKLIEEAIVHAKAAMKMEPPLAKDMTGKEKEAFLAGFRKMMEMVVAEFGNMKKALEENRNADAETSYRKLLLLKKDGHEKYVE